MTAKDLFQTSLRIAGVLLLFYFIPLVLSELLGLSGIGGAGAVAITLFRVLWQILVPLWMVAGAKALTRAIYGSA